MKHQTVLVLDFGGQYNQLIARRVRECAVYCEVLPHNTPLEELSAKKPIGIIFTGGPNSVYESTSPKVDPQIFSLGIPVLGICYGVQLMAYTLGGHVVSPDSREYGKTVTHFDTTSPLFQGLPETGITWMSHTDYIDCLPQGFVSVAHSDTCPTAAMQDLSRQLFGIQFHPEVLHTENGVAMLRNFLYRVCGAKGDWTMGDYAANTIAALREKIGDGKVLLGLSQLLPPCSPKRWETS